MMYSMNLSHMLTLSSRTLPETSLQASLHRRARSTQHAVLPEPVLPGPVLTVPVRPEPVLTDPVHPLWLSQRMTQKTLHPLLFSPASLITCSSCGLLYYSPVRLPRWRTRCLERERGRDTLLFQMDYRAMLFYLWASQRK